MHGDKDELDRLFGSVRAPLESLFVLFAIALIAAILATLLLWNGLD